MSIMTPQELIQELVSYGLSQSQIAKRAGVPVSIVSTVLAGKRKYPRYTYIDSLRVLCHEVRRQQTAPPIP